MQGKEPPRKNEKLMRARHRKNWSQEEAAEKLDISLSQYARLEKGITKRPNFFTLKQLEETFGMSKEDLGFLTETSETHESPISSFDFSQISPPLNDQDLLTPLQQPHSPSLSFQKHPEEAHGEQKSQFDVHTISQEGTPLSKPAEGPSQKKESKTFSPQHKRLFSLLLVVFVVLLVGGGFWYNQARHVIVTATDCDDLLVQSQQLPTFSYLYLNNELSQIHQRLQSCTLPTGLWTLNANGYQGMFLITLNYQGTFQAVFQLNNEPAYNLKGQWNVINSQIAFSRSSADKTEVQTFTGVLKRLGTGYILVGTFVDTESKNQVFRWSATINKIPDSSAES